MGNRDLGELERTSLRLLGSCPGQFTATTMAMVAETLGLALPASATFPAVSPDRSNVARQAGATVMQLLERGGPLPRELVTKKSLENASAAVAATGGSTNAAPVNPANGHEAGIPFTLGDFPRRAKRTAAHAGLNAGG